MARGFTDKKGRFRPTDSGSLKQKTNKSLQSDGLKMKGMKYKTELELVKRANLFNDNGTFRIIHYETEIFAYDPKTGTAIAKKDLSRTSNKQIKRAIAFFKPKKVEYIEADQKWSFSG